MYPQGRGREDRKKNPRGEQTQKTPRGVHYKREHKKKTKNRGRRD